MFAMCMNAMIFFSVVADTVASGCFASLCPDSRLTNDLPFFCEHETQAFRLGVFLLILLTILGFMMRESLAIRHRMFHRRMEFPCRVEGWLQVCGKDIFLFFYFFGRGVTGGWV